MADDIYINTGTSFQQQYTARVPAAAQQPVSGQVPAQQPANNQTPFTYANRNPFTYRNPVSNQSPYIANAQQPYPYIANGQTPFIANRQNPYPYIAQARQPAIYQHPFTYTRQAQQPYINQVPSTYARQGQTPFTYQHRNPSSYQARQPSTYQHPTTYARQGQARQPAIYQHRTPSTYRNPVNRQNAYPYIANAQQPIIADRQNAYPYIANARQPLIGNHNVAYPYIANAQTSYSVQGNQPYWYTGESEILNQFSVNSSTFEEPHNNTCRIIFDIDYTSVKANGRYDIEVLLTMFQQSSDSIGWKKYQAVGSAIWTTYTAPIIAYKVLDVPAASGWTVKHARSNTVADDPGAYLPNETLGAYNGNPVELTATSIIGNGETGASLAFDATTTSPGDSTATWNELLTFEHSTEADQTCSWELNMHADAEGGF